MPYTQYPAQTAQSDANASLYYTNRETAFNMVIDHIQKLAKLGALSHELSVSFFSSWQLEELLVAQGYKVTKVGDPLTRVIVSWELASPAGTPPVPVVDFTMTVPDDDDPVTHRWAVQFDDTSSNNPTLSSWEIYNQSGDTLLFSMFGPSVVAPLPTGTYQVYLLSGNLGGLGTKTHKTLVVGP